LLLTMGSERFSPAMNMYYMRILGLAIHQPDCNCGKCVLPLHARTVAAPIGSQAGENSSPLTGSVRCPDCARGDKPMLLDRDGVKCSISGNEGTWCHAYDINWWPCTDKGGAPNGPGEPPFPATER
jgi:hypothetical protein